MIYRKNIESAEPLQKRGVKPKVSEEVINLVRSYTLENKTRTQQEIANYVYKKLGVEISQPSICVLLKQIGITRKKLTYHYTQLDEEKAKVFNEEIKPLLLNNVPFMALDECSFYPNQDPKFEINPIGDERTILLMDNSRVHTAPNKREEAKVPSVEAQMANKNMEVRFITAYAPMLNPTELVFCLLRQQTEKNRPRNFEEMEKTIKKVVDLLNTKDLRKYF
ncbi:hypothetical protein C1645_834759 [Glomus cerebriforme]|uniref:Tc1-like transposase DDE domain-containing protein n=1 Tax=Glomus cerebriforme TaxID=658196 RepID=A0A397SD83_9GLOM|nr:hypothetical protein C1645_834759 [Glomus cerebriforme]